ncbi:MAG: hypothetical protein JST05_02155 [Acidobacteria bacterium]|nr:hypothetical protein [Acidobacteriota bacterium]
MTHVRGLIQNIVRAALSDGLQAAEWEGYLQSLSSGAQAQMAQNATEFEWVPMAGLVEAAAKHPHGRAAVNQLLRGSLYADLMMTDKHRWMLKVMTPSLMVEETPRMFAFYHRGGRMEVERLEPGLASVAFKGRGPSSAWFSVLLSAWFKRCLELSGAEAVEVAYDPPEATGIQDLHRYRLRWH